MQSRVIVLAGPSGAGKSRLAERLGLPILRLDDYYRSGTDPGLPRIAEGANAGLVDWDDPRSWDLEAATAALDALCRDGRVDVPIYSIPDNAAVGTRPLVLDQHEYVVAEGIFAAEVVPHCLETGTLAAAYCVRQHPWVTFWRRLYRDLREHRKPPLVLVRRGVALLRDQRRVVDHAVAQGCRPVTGDEGFAEIGRLLAGAPAGRP